MQRKTKLSNLVLAAAWTAVGVSALWSVNALADGIERRRVVRAAPPEAPELLGGPQADPIPVPQIVAQRPEQVKLECINFADVVVLLEDMTQVEDPDAATVEIKRELDQQEYCDGVRELIKVVLTPPPPPEWPEPPEPPEPPGGGGGPGYLSRRG